MYARCECLHGAAVHVQKQLRQCILCCIGDSFRMQQRGCRSLLQLFRGMQYLIEVWTASHYRLLKSAIRARPLRIHVDILSNEDHNTQDISN